MYKFLTILFVIILGLSVNAQELKRIASKGMSLLPMNDSIATSHSAEKGKGYLCLKVLPGTTAENLKVKESDILLKINNTEINSVADFSNPNAVVRDGETVSYTVFRNKKTVVLTGKAIANPFEKSETLNVEYSSFPFQSGLIRSIYLKPKTSGKKPAILFIPGYTCISLDNLYANHPYQKLVYGMAEKGYIVMRSEKPGMGDCMDTPKCYDIDFPTEVESFRTALKELKKHPEVDTNNIFVLGHSLGGMEAPFVAQGNNVKGIIVMGITIKPWLEYLTEMLRIQNPNLGIDYVQNEKDMKLYETLLYELLVSKKSPSDMVKLNSEYERILKRDFGYMGGNDFLSRDIIFSQSLNDMNIVDVWANTTCKVLSAWGTTDIQTLSSFSHLELVKIVNQYHPGNATFLELTETDHSFRIIPTVEESYKSNYEKETYLKYQNTFNTKMIEDFHSWINNVIKNP